MDKLAIVKETQKHTQKEAKHSSIGPSSSARTAHECAYLSIQLWYTRQHRTVLIIFHLIEKLVSKIIAT